MANTAKRERAKNKPASERLSDFTREDIVSTRAEYDETSKQLRRCIRRQNNAEEALRNVPKGAEYDAMRDELTEDVADYASERQKLEMKTLYQMAKLRQVASLILRVKGTTFMYKFIDDNIDMIQTAEEKRNK